MGAAAVLPVERWTRVKPLVQEEHEACSALLGTIGSEHALLSLPPHDQFHWLHRFYLLLDAVAERHSVYKLYGGPHGFMISTGVAEPSINHAAVLLRFALDLRQATHSIRLPCQIPLDLRLVLTSGPACSGLLGTASLTYQMVGRAVAVARELLNTQTEVPFMVTADMKKALPPSFGSMLVPLGGVRLRASLCGEQEVFSLQQYASLKLTQPAHLPACETVAGAGRRE